MKLRHVLALLLVTMFVAAVAYGPAQAADAKDKVFRWRCPTVLTSVMPDYKTL